MGLQILIGGGVIAGIYRYFGVLKRLIEGQEKIIATQAEQMKALKITIEAQAEQMKAQSTVLQDLERLNKMMQQAFDCRDQAYKEQVECNATTYQRERLAERRCSKSLTNRGTPGSFSFHQGQGLTPSKRACWKRSPGWNGSGD
jgi:hypothetical protein